MSVFVGVAIAPNPNESCAGGADTVAAMRRLSATDAMLLVTVTLWSLNFTASKYILTHGFQPLVYSSIRYGSAALALAALAFARERSLRIAWRDFALLVLPAAGMLVANQYSFVYALEYSTASTVALVLGTTPVFVGLLAFVFGLERLRGPFWIAAGVSFAGVALVAAGSGNVSGTLKGDLIAIGTAASWAAYSVLIVPLMRRYSAYRASSVVMLAMAVGISALASRQLARQTYAFTTLTWVSFAYSVVGPVMVAQVLWFLAVDRVGAGRASLFANAQPFLATIFAILLLSETLSRLEIAGGALIAAGIVLERRARVAVVQQPPGE
jgi:drug/metabolite transporter (DMT)-like permease